MIKVVCDLCGVELPKGVAPYILTLTRDTDHAAGLVIFRAELCQNCKDLLDEYKGTCRFQGGADQLREHWAEMARLDATLTHEINGIRVSAAEYEAHHKTIPLVSK
jgi:hypothetical protein